MPNKGKNILSLEKINVNGGKREFQVEILQSELVMFLNAIPVRVGIERRG